MSCVSNLSNLGGWEGVMGIPKFLVVWTEVQVAWEPHLWLASEVNEGSLVALIPYPVGSALTLGSSCHNLIKL